MPFAVLVLATVLVELAVCLPLGSLPLALAADGVPTPGIAAVMAAGNAAVLLGSVPAGALVDRVGRLAVIRGGATLAVATLALLAVAHGPWLTGAATALRGVALTAYVTAEFAYAAALVRSERSVSAVATLGMIGNLTFATAPAAAVWLWQHGVGREQYWFGVLVGAAGVVALLFLPRRHDLRVRRSRRILMRSAWLPTMAFLAAATLMGGVNSALAVIALHARGIANGALLFTATAATTFALRYPAGRAVERWGARAVAVPTAVAQCAGALLVAHAGSAAGVVVGGAVLGLAWSAMVPVGIGLFFERSTRGTRGAAMGAYNLSFGIGSTLGAGLATLAAAIPHAGYPAAVVLAGLAPLLTLPAILRSPAARRVPAPAPG